MVCAYIKGESAFFVNIAALEKPLHEALRRVICG